MNPNSFAMTVVSLVLCLFSASVQSQAGRIGAVTVAPDIANVSAPTTTNTTRNTVLAAPTTNTSVGAVSGQAQLNYSPTSNATPVGISAPGSNASFTPTAVSGQGGTVEWAPVSVNNVRSAAANVSSNFAPVINLPPSILQASQVCMPINTPRDPILLPRTMVESGALFGVAYTQAMVKNEQGARVPGLVTERIDVPSKPIYSTISAFLYRRSVIDGKIRPSVVSVEINYGQLWEIHNVTVGAATGGSIGGAFSNASNSGGVSTGSTSGVGDVVRLAHWKGTDCVANDGYVRQVLFLSKSETEADCYVAMFEKGELKHAPYTGTPECRRRWTKEALAAQK